MRTFGAPRVLITGAADGVGRACARSLAGWGVNLILADDDGPALRAVCDELDVAGRFCDVASETSVSIFAEDLAARSDAIDVLINAAGGAYVRALGMWRVSRALLPCMTRGRGGKLIINVASPAIEGPGGSFHYASSRDAFERLSAALHDYTKGSSIAVHTILPDETLPEGDAADEYLAGEVISLIAASFLDLEPAALKQRRSANDRK